MSDTESCIRLAVVSPFLDKRHGTERAVVEWLSHLPERFEIHIYSQRVEQMDRSRYTLHKIPKLPGPHLLNFLWWIVANPIWRWFDAVFRGARYDIVYSPGANCLNADALSVHIVFAEYRKKVAPQVSFSSNPLRLWPVILHRRLFYALAAALERRTYDDRGAELILYARKTGDEITRHYGRPGPFPILYLGLDHSTFNPQRRGQIRSEARRTLAISQDQFVLLLVGNDWRNKGLPVLVRALAKLPELPVHLLVTTTEKISSCRELISSYGMIERVRFLPPRVDVEFYYAAADAYAGPSLEDTFALPPAEAMACGLPVIVSSANGTSEIITDETDGLVLRDPQDSVSLAAMIRRLVTDCSFSEHLGNNAAQTMLRFTWEKNGQDLAKIFDGIIARKRGHSTQTLAPESRTC
ncbi:MAG TPA: glycosyltransferase [Candidatus Acidoferrum sp.]|nr:glycosyltransferase [Candidatus Acidoferrum sp.]